MSYEDEVIDQFLDGWDDEWDDDDDEELMGRRKRRKRRGRVRRPARRPSPAFRGQASGVKLQAPTQARLLALGFDSVSDVAAGTSATINSQPQVVFRPDRLVIPNSIAPHFLVNDLKVGKNSMFISATGVPAQAFAHDSSGVGMKMDTAQVSQIISISVTNTHALTDYRFTAALIGPSVE